MKSVNRLARLAAKPTATPEDQELFARACKSVLDAEPDNLVHEELTLNEDTAGKVTEYGTIIAEILGCEQWQGESILLVFATLREMEHPERLNAYLANQG
jgi:hypothetical protein